jgi:uncharacterized protein YyaL (SSP411 family)
MDRRGFLNQIACSGLAMAVLSGSILADSLHSGPNSIKKVKWQKNLKAAQKLAVQQDKPIMIVFGASWCTFCHKLEKETLTDKKTVTMIEQEFIPVHLDFDRDAKIAKILEVERLPCTVILSPDADLLVRSEGFAEPREYQATLISALEKRAEIYQVRGSGSRE